jgi:transcriptional regulator with XRE-family HTH domain
MTRLVTALEKIRKKMNADRVMDNIRQAFERSGMTLKQLGEGLGYEGPTAKKRAWLLLYRTSDPRISTVLAVAETLGVKIGELTKE